MIVVLPQKGRVRFSEKECHKYLTLILVYLRTQWGANGVSMLIKSHHKVVLSAVNYRGNSHAIFKGLMTFL